MGKFFKLKNIEIHMVEVDVLRGGKRHNLLQSSSRIKVMKEVEAKHFDVVIASPPCSTFSRARCTSDFGPRPLRSSRFPRGFPWLSGAARITADEANSLVDFTSGVLRAQMSQGGVGLLEHPEDLGQVRQKDGTTLCPASIWRWPQVRSLLTISQVTWGAIYQEDFGTEYKKPTRLLTNLPDTHRFMCVGEPQFSEDGFYIGPLIARAQAGVKLHGAKGTDGFNTSASAAWPTALCKRLSEMIVEHITSQDHQKWVDKVPSVGVTHLGIKGSAAAVGVILGGAHILPVSQGTTSRRKITDEELALVRSGRGQELEGVYVGRSTAPGGTPSRWANPFRIGVHGNREGVIDLFKAWIKKDMAEGEVQGLLGKTLLCHCTKDQECHADFLCVLAEEEYKRLSKSKFLKLKLVEAKDNFKGNRDNDPVMMDYIDDGLPVRCGKVSRSTLPTCRPGPHQERKSSFMGKSRTFEDGGGLCSPGRLRKQDRQCASPLSKEILAQARLLLDDSVRRRSGGKDTSLTFMMKLAAGRFEECPFDQGVLDEMVGFLQKALGLKAEDCTAALGQSFRLRMFKYLLKELGDPDWQFFDQLEEGVPVGVGVTMPRTPLVFDQKVKWALDEDSVGAQHEVENYRSLKGYEEEVKKLFQEEERLGWMKEMSDEEARKEYGENLFLAGLAVVVEKDKFRVVHDGTHGVKVNSRIRVQDQVKSPTAGEIRTLMKERYQDTGGSKQFVLVGDVSKAHRRVMVRRQDWGWQACRLQEGRIWVNCVGTYGMSSAGYWWARLSSSVLIRLFYYLLASSGLQDALLFADDILMIAGRASEIIDLGALILVWVALGVPWKWKKWRGGHQASWIGYWLCFESYQLGISEARSKWLRSWIEKTLSDGAVQMEDFRAVLGRISFTLGVLDYLKPFVSPLFAWASAIDHLGRVLLPWSVSFILSYVRSELEDGRRTTVVRPREIFLGPVFRADAKAEGQVVVLGGWECRNGCHPSSARWFSLALTRRTAPWAFSRGEPFRTIAALELFASLVSLMVFGDSMREGTNGVLHLTGLTDNSGNVSALSRLMSSKFPLIVILTELAAQMRERRLELDLEWIPRNQNEEADAITNGKTGLFDPSKKIEVEVASLKFIVLNKMVEVADHLYEQVKTRRSEKIGSGLPVVVSRGKKRPLKESDPW